MFERLFKSITQKGNALLGLGQFDEAKECYESLRELGENSAADKNLAKLHDAQEKDILHKLYNKIYIAKCCSWKLDQHKYLDRYLKISFQNQQPSHVKRRNIENKYSVRFDANEHLVPSFSFALPGTFLTDNKRTKFICGRFTT